MKVRDCGNAEGGFPERQFFFFFFFVESQDINWRILEEKC